MNLVLLPRRAAQARSLGMSRLTAKVIRIERSPDDPPNTGALDLEIPLVYSLDMLTNLVGNMDNRNTGMLLSYYGPSGERGGETTGGAVTAAAVVREKGARERE